MPNATLTPEDQLAAIRSKLSELFGIAPDASDEDFAAAFDKYVTDADGDDKAQEAATLAKIKEAHDAHKTAMDSMISNYETQLSGLKAKHDEMAAELSNLKGEKMQSDIKAFHAEVDALLDGLIKEGKMLPAERAANRGLLITANRETKIKFADEAGKEVEQTAFDSLVGVLKARPVAIKFSEQSQALPEAEKPKDQPVAAPEGIKRFQDNGLTIDERSAKVDALARKLMAEKNIGYGAAMSIAAKEVK